jgi:hypothetical protein
MQIRFYRYKNIFPYSTLPKLHPKSRKSETRFETRALPRRTIVLLPANYEIMGGFVRRRALVLGKQRTG